MRRILRVHSQSDPRPEDEAALARKSAPLRVIFLQTGTHAYKSTQTGDAAKGLAGVFTIK